MRFLIAFLLASNAFSSGSTIYSGGKGGGGGGGSGGGDQVPKERRMERPQGNRSEGGRRRLDKEVEAAKERERRAAEAERDIMFGNIDIAIANNLNADHREREIELLHREQVEVDPTVDWRPGGYYATREQLHEWRKERATAAYDDAHTWAKTSQQSEIISVGREFLNEGIAEPNIDISAKLLFAAETVLDLAFSLIPGCDVFKDTYEAIVGCNLITGETLDKTDRTMAVIGILTAGAGSKLYKVGKLAFKKFERLNKIHDFKFLYEKPISELKQTLGFLKKHPKLAKNGLTDDKAQDFSKAFMRDSKVHVLTEDTVVYRYHVKGEAPQGFWLTRNKVDNPHETLALYHDLPVDAHTFTIPKGTEIMEGIVAPQTGYKFRPGGGNQIVVGDPGVLK